MRKKTQPRRYRALRVIHWGPRFKLEAGQEFTEANLLPGMEAALLKWLRVGAAEVVEEKQITEDKQQEVDK